MTKPLRAQREVRYSESAGNAGLELIKRGAICACAWTLSSRLASPLGPHEQSFVRTPGPGQEACYHEVPALLPTPYPRMVDNMTEAVQ
eukprot:134756-Amphidinium_carterae.1